MCVTRCVSSHYSDYSAVTTQSVEDVKENLSEEGLGLSLGLEHTGPLWPWISPVSQALGFSVYKGSPCHQL